MADAQKRSVKWWMLMPFRVWTAINWFLNDERLVISVFATFVFSIGKMLGNGDGDQFKFFGFISIYIVVMDRTVDKRYV